MAGVHTPVLISCTNGCTVDIRIPESRTSGLIVNRHRRFLQRQRSGSPVPQRAVSDNGHHFAGVFQVLRGQPGPVEDDRRVVGTRAELEEGKVIATSPRVVVRVTNDLRHSPRLHTRVCIR